jgi:hypothetical protein
MNVKEVNKLKIRNILIRCSIIVLLMCLSTAFMPKHAVYAAEKASSEVNGGAVINAEQTEWKYRVVDGKLQKRLWSLTYGIWLTDWEWV